MTDKKKHFLDFKTFWDTVGEKRSHSGALEDINMLVVILEHLKILICLNLMLLIIIRHPMNTL
jgi:hypothetical protein